MIFWIKHSITFEDKMNYNFVIILSNYTNYFIFWSTLIGRNFLLNFEFLSKRNMILKKNTKWKMNFEAQSIQMNTFISWIIYQVSTKIDIA